jgi:ribosomal protein S7
MSRRSTAQKRPVTPDPVYNSRLATMLVNRLMRSGKKSLAFRIVYDAFKLIEERTGNSPLETFEQAVRNTTPLVEVRARPVPPTKSPWKSAQSGVQPCPCAGYSNSRGNGLARACLFV